MSTTILTVAELGSVVRGRRRQLGYTQARTAELCGTGTRFVSDLENGKETVELGKVLAVTATLCIDIVMKVRGNRD